MICAAQELMSVHEQSDLSSEQEHSQLIALIESVSMFQQAHQLWPSQVAKEEELRAARMLIGSAVEMGDLDIAAAYLNEINREENKDLEEQLVRAQDQRRNELQAFQRSKRLTTSLQLTARPKRTNKQLLQLTSRPRKTEKQQLLPK